jgi:transposase
MMTKRTVRNRSPAFKARMPLAAVKGKKALTELAEQFDVHGNQILQRKDQLLEAATATFGAAVKTDATSSAIDVEIGHAMIGELVLENFF